MHFWQRTVGCAAVAGTAFSLASFVQAGPVRSDRADLSGEHAASSPALGRVVQAVGADLSESLYEAGANGELQSMDADPKVIAFLDASRWAAPPGLAAAAGPLKFWRSSRVDSTSDQTGASAPRPMETLFALEEALDRFNSGEDVRRLSEEERGRLAEEVFENASLRRTLEVSPPLETGEALVPRDDAPAPSSKMPDWYNRLGSLPFHERGPAAVLSHILSEHDVLLLGPHHDSLSALPLLAASLSGLKREGLGVVGIENAHQSDQTVDRMEIRYQSEINKYQLTRLWWYLDQLGMRMTGIDLPRQAIESFLKKEMDRRSYVMPDELAQYAKWLAGQRARKDAQAANSQAQEPEDASMLALFAKAARSGEVFNTKRATTKLRNRFMARRMTTAMKKAGKGVVVIGFGHVATTPKLFDMLDHSGRPWFLNDFSLADALQRRGLKVFSLMLTGGRMPEEFDQVKASQWLRSVFARALAGNAEGRMALRLTSATTGIFHMGGAPFRKDVILPESGAN